MSLFWKKIVGGIENINCKIKCIKLIFRLGILLVSLVIKLVMEIKREDRMVK